MFIKTQKQECGCLRDPSASAVAGFNWEATGVGPSVDAADALTVTKTNSVAANIAAVISCFLYGPTAAIFAAESLIQHFTYCVSLLLIQSTCAALLTKATQYYTSEPAG